MKKFLNYITVDEKGTRLWLTIFTALGTATGLLIGVMFWNKELGFLQNIIPIVTIPMGFACVYLLGNRKNSGNYVGFFANIAEGVTNFMFGNFGMFIVTIYYGFSHIVGLFDWGKNSKNNSDDRVSVKSVEGKRDVVIMIIAFIVSTIMIFVLDKLNVVELDFGSFYTIGNILVMYLGILSQGLMILRYKEAWIGWVIMNLIAIPLNIVTGNYVYAVMYVFYQFNALVSLYSQYTIDKGE